MKIKNSKSQHFISKGDLHYSLNVQWDFFCNYKFVKFHCKGKFDLKIIELKNLPPFNDKIFRRRFQFDLTLLFSIIFQPQIFLSIFCAKRDRFSEQGRICSIMCVLPFGFHDLMTLILVQVLGTSFLFS